MQKIIFPNGSWKSIDPKNFVKGDLDFDKLFQKMAKRYNIPFSNKCCDQDVTSRPVRYNETAARLEMYDSATLTWIEVPA